MQGHSVARDPPFWDGDQGGPKESQLASTLGFGSGLYYYLEIKKINLYSELYCTVDMP